MNEVHTWSSGATLWISGRRATGRSTRLLDEASRWQEADDEVLTYILTHTVHSAERYMMDMVMERIKGWVENDPECEYPLDPQRTIVHSAGAAMAHGGSRLRGLDGAVFIDDFDIIEQRQPDILEQLRCYTRLTVAAVVVEER